MTDPSVATSLRDLETAAPFSRRHIGPDVAEQQAMLSALGFDSFHDLLYAALPDTIRTDKALDLPPALSEVGAREALLALSERNNVKVPMIGLGYHGTITPAVIRRNVLEDPSWYTAYTPYQPEISQGRLEALLNFQTMVGDLSGLPTANASLLDEATAAAEAMTLVRRANRKNTSSRFVVDEGVLPQTIAVVRTRAEAMGITVDVRDAYADLPTEDVAGVLVQYPEADGRVRDPRPVIDAVHAAGGLAVVASDLLALTVLESPGHYGADVVLGSSQRFGVPLFYGGPHAGFMAVSRRARASPARAPGRGLGRRGGPTGVPTRAADPRAAHPPGQGHVEHLHRAGPAGGRGLDVRRLPRSDRADPDRAAHPPLRGRAGRCAPSGRCRRRARDVLRHHQRASARAGRRRTPRRQRPGPARARRRRRTGSGSHCPRSPPATTSTHVLKAFGLDVADWDSLDGTTADAVPAALVRETAFLTHPVFNDYRSETDLLRYLKRLSDRDYALDRGMIPLGSCTMKLNATAEMEPISFPGFADLHPFAPADDALGYVELVETLERWLAEVTGYAEVSIQPNAGSQGELAGLLAIRGYHHARGDQGRDVCLIPSSAHGTNAASAVMAGMRVVVVKATDEGSVDLDDLREKCEAHSDQLAAIMVTYPSTHGAFEGTIIDLCEIVHEHGGQVYVDGANLNALLGLAKPGQFGGDVSHLNLHKTFCIPHGGGGPGVGPVAVAAHLAPYLPSHPMHPDRGRHDGIGPVSAAPYGSAGILPISWAYIAMMGAAGLTEATSVAVLSANYIARRLTEHYPVLYKGHGDLVAHECILDLRALTKASGVSVDDVAKRLIDYGFHAPTMSFPVPGTFMVEPTESESLAELDRFIDAMIAIRKEIADVEEGRVELAASPLVHAPHTTAAITGEWDRAYSREVGAFPAGHLVDKYWPPVARIDQAYGDRNLVCTCPDPSAFADA